MSTATTMKSIGLHGHWGFSSAFDFVEAIANGNTSTQELPSELNILLVSPGDIRHILCTISKLCRNRGKDTPMPKVNFFLLESPIEVLARELVLLELFCDFELPVRQRATVFLEAFGNLKVQRRTNAYLELLSQRLRTLMSKGDGVLEDVLDFGHLGYREKDYLEAAFKNYDRSVEMDMAGWFDHRKRGLYEERYDNRKALYDWDYHSGVKARASIVHIKQFKHWRETGIAYEFGDQEYVEPNKSMMTFAEGFLKSGRDKGLKKEVMGYWGDIVCSPYFAFGVDCETSNKHAEGLFEIYNKGTGSEQHRHHAVEVALHQLFSFMWELETSAVYSMTRANDVYSGLGKSSTSAASQGDQLPMDMNEEANAAASNSADKKEAAKEDNDEPVLVVDEDKEATEKAAAIAPGTSQPLTDVSEQEAVVARALDTVEHLLNHLEHVRIYPMTTPPSKAEKKGASSSQENTTSDSNESNSAIAQLLGKQKYQGFFHGVFVSARYAQLVNYKVLSDILVPSSTSGIAPVVAVETAKFLVSLSSDVKRDFTGKIDEFASQKQHFHKIHPVLRRRRDEQDPDDDVFFYSTSG